MKKIPQSLPGKINPDTLKQILKDRKVMIAVTRESFFYFFYIYFGRYIKCPIAPFHFEMFRIAQDEKIKRAGIMTFRNSAKSTILNTAYSLWAIMGTPQKEHIVIASQIQQRSKDHLMNIRKEIESNQLLSENLGPFSIGEDRWGATTLIIPAYKARISAISIEEGIRGLKEGPNRPDLIIADDIEDSSSVKTNEMRDKTFNWFTGELIPLGEIDTKVIVLGNFLYQDSVLFRLGEMIKEGKMKGVFLRIPLVDENDKIAWPGKFPTLESIEEFKKSIGNEITWQRDFLLRIIPDDFQIVRPEHIHYYDKLPSQESENEFKYTWTAVDPAISEKSSADFTAMVSAQIHGNEENLKIYILSNPINERMDFPTAVEKIKKISKILGKGRPTKVFIESNAFQDSLSQQLKYQNYLVESVKTVGDKKERLNLVSPLIENGTVLFPRKGAEKLIEQLVNFGIERHDDLVDAFTMLVFKALGDNQPIPSITWI